MKGALKYADPNMIDAVPPHGGAYANRYESPRGRFKRDVISKQDPPFLSQAIASIRILAVKFYRGVVSANIAQGLGAYECVSTDKR